MLPDRALGWARTVYFCYYAAWAALLPFLPLYYASLAFPASRIGLLNAIPPLATLVAAPLWAGLADATGRHRQVLLGALAGAGLAALALWWARSFGVLVALVVAYAICAAPIIPLVDSGVLALLGARRERYGRQRVWGAVGWGVSAPLVGWLAERGGLAWPFAAYVALVAATALAASRLPLHPGRAGGSYWHGARRLLTDRRASLFLAAVFLAGIGQAALNFYLFLTLEALGAARSTMGLALSVATLSELPVLLWAGGFVRRWGPRGVLMLSMGAYVVRALGISLATAPWQVLPLQLFHGLTFSAMWVAGVTLAADIAPPGLEATAQGLFSSTLMGVGGTVGALVNGLLFERLGGAGMFRANAALVGMGLALLVWGVLAERR